MTENLPAQTPCAFDQEKRRRALLWYVAMVCGIGVLSSAGASTPTGHPTRY